MGGSVGDHALSRLFFEFSDALRFDAVVGGHVLLVDGVALQSLDLALLPTEEAHPPMIVQKHALEHAFACPTRKPSWAHPLQSVPSLILCWITSLESCDVLRRAAAAISFCQMP